MPIIQVTMLAGRTKDQKQALMRELTSAAVETLGSDPESVRVMIYEVSSDDFAVAGQTMAERKAAAAK